MSMYHGKEQRSGSDDQNVDYYIFFFMLKQIFPVRRKALGRAYFTSAYTFYKKGRSFILAFAEFLGSFVTAHISTFRHSHFVQSHSKTNVKHTILPLSFKG